MDQRLRSAVCFALESLETRRLLASISGTILEDVNANGGRDGRDRPMPGVRVYLDQNRNRQFDPGETSAFTDNAGYYEFTNLAPGRYFLAQELPASYGQISPPAGGRGDYGGEYDIELLFQGDNISTELKSLFESAAARWEKVIVGDIPAIESSDIGEVDDIAIDVFARSIDGAGGVLANARTTELRPADSSRPHLPMRAEMNFDTDDLADPTTFETILHEMGHALGFSLTVWFEYVNPLDLNELTLVSGTVVDPLFIGENAVREYNRIFGTNATGVPLQNYSAGTGSSFSHWSENVFGAELMTPFPDGVSGEPLSRITIALMEDLGYTVDYAGADPYVPDGQPVPITTPDNAGGGQLPFGYTIDLNESDSESRGRDFFSRINRRPTLDRLDANNAFFATGDVVNLRAVGAADADSADSVRAVNFYVESNGTEGLQTGQNGDTLIGTDPNPAGGFSFKASTGRLALPAGETTFYARAYDQLDAVSRPRFVTVQLFPPDTPAPAKPTAISASAVSNSQVMVNWNDRSNNEFAFRLERALDQGFLRDVRRFTLPAGTESFLDSGLEIGTTYFYRVRAFNVGGASGFSGPATVTTLSAREVIVDNADPAAAFEGQVATVLSNRARGGSYTVLSSLPAVGTFSPDLPVASAYYVYASWRSEANVGASNRALFSVTDVRGRITSITIDQNTRGRDGGEVLLGQFRFAAGNAPVLVVRPETSDDVITLDAIRFQAIG